MEKNAKPSTETEKVKEEDKYKNIKIDELQLGIWKMKLAPEPGLNLSKRWEAITTGFPLFVRLVTDIFHLAPKLLILLVFCQIWTAVQDTLLLQQSNNLLKTFEASLLSGRANVPEILKVVISRGLWTALASWITWYQSIIADSLEWKVSRHYELALMRSSLETDLLTAQSHGSKKEVSSHQAWYCLQEIIMLHTTVIQLASKLILIMQLSRSTGGPLIAFLCAFQPLCSVLFSSNLWAAACLAFVTNKHHTRMEALRKFSSQKFKSDIISGGLARWIGDEFQKSHAALGSMSGKHPVQLLDIHGQRKFDYVIEYLRDLPTVFFSVKALIRPSDFSVSSIAALHQTSNSLRDSISTTLNVMNSAHKSFLKVKMLYDALIPMNSMRMGDTPYPHIPEKPSKMVDPSKGMSFQLKDLTFSYAGSENATPALNNISLSIKPGDLVIIVGANGSGKSTLIRLLSRLYDPTSGTILIDDLPSSQYKLDDLHKATSVLSQDSLIYPLSLGENIGLGYPECMGDKDMVREAAGQGGALAFVEKLKDGMETTLESSLQMYQRNLYGKPTHPLYLEMKKIRNDLDISGGEKQRVVAARTFMRFKSGKIKFVAVDEPSSALDAEGELELFNNLMAVREGKTMVFVTHRFGHLTKYANLIVCMKDGSIVESGTHVELMQKKGEYSKLYKIQASAFSDA